MTKAEETKAFQVLTNIHKNVNNLKWQCMVTDCEENSINSHLLQRNGVLNYIVEDGHLRQISAREFFNAEKKGFLEFKKIGLNQAISYPLFCNQHDTDIFKSIEGRDINFETYQTQLLFSYRGLCAELRKKQKIVEQKVRLLASKTLEAICNQDFFLQQERVKGGSEQGVIDLTYYKEAFETDLAKNNEQFIFHTLRFPFVKISLSAVFSHQKKINKNSLTNASPLNAVFINAIPQADCLYIIVGHHKGKTDGWIREYINYWLENDRNVPPLTLLSDLIMRIETWTLGESLFKTIPDIEWDKFKKEYIDDMFNQTSFTISKNNILAYRATKAS